MYESIDPKIFLECNLPLKKIKKKKKQKDFEKKKKKKKKENRGISRINNHSYAREIIFIVEHEQWAII